MCLQFGDEYRVINPHNRRDGFWDRAWI
jgi:hypothetical protein